MRTAATLIGLVAAGWGAAAIAQSEPHREPLATRAGWEIGLQGSHYRYEEPDFAEWEGNRLGITGAYTATGANRVFTRIDMRASYARLDYVGSGTLEGAPDLIFESRILVGRSYIRGDRLALAPYTGLGYRYLLNDIRGTTSTGAQGYKRSSNYLYVPFGFAVRMHAGGDWAIVPQIEYKILIRGRQRSYLSNAGLGLNDVSNKQGNGSGFRVQLVFERGNWAFGPWLHYWDIKDSDVQPAGQGLFGLEPANTTRESGVELRYRF